VDEIEKKVRRALLKPISDGTGRSRRRRQYSDALGILDERAVGENALQQNRALLVDPKAADRSEKWKDPSRAVRLVALAKILCASRRISKQEFVFFASSPVESVHEGRLQGGHYRVMLGPISEAMAGIEKEHGLKPDQYWARGQGPKDHTCLSQQYDKVTDDKFAETLREVDLEDLATLWEKDRAEFDRLRERGRRSVVHKDEYIFALQDVTVQCELDARKAATGGAYSAAITSLGAGVEGLLLLRCLRSRTKSMRCAAKLPKRTRPRATTDPGTWRFETLIEVCLAAGWLRPVETNLAIYDTAGLAHMLRRPVGHSHAEGERRSPRSGLARQRCVACAYGRRYRIR
jgi:hypothetical protein